jgi:hypothetical protein
MLLQRHASVSLVSVMLLQEAKAAGVLAEYVALRSSSGARPVAAPVVPLPVTSLGGIVEADGNCQGVQVAVPAAAEEEAEEEAGAGAGRAAAVTKAEAGANASVATGVSDEQ